MTDLPMNPFGSTGASVTALGYGSMDLGKKRDRRLEPVASDVAVDVLNEVLDAGINFIDTSPDYRDAESLIGRAIAHRRGEYFLASKCGCPVNQPRPVDGGTAPHVFTRENVRAGVEQSLTRMNTDYLDLVQIHMSPSRQEVEDDDSVAELEALRDEGKVRFIGISTTFPNIADHIAMGVFDAFQIPYSLVEPDHDEWIVKAADAGAGTVIRGGVARGISAVPTVDLDGMTDISRRYINRRRELWREASLDELLGDMTAMEFILRFTLSHPHVSTTIVGTSNVEHLADNVAAARKGPLPDDVYQQAKDRISKVA
jgi:aryl-alcohol dehydrogenase-like predicted oxidoreductase